MPSQRYIYLNSTLVKEVARHGGQVKGLLPGVVERRLKQKLRETKPMTAPVALPVKKVSSPGKTDPTPAGKPAGRRGAAGARARRG